MSGPTVEDVTALRELLLTPCNACGHEPDEHGSRGCGMCACEADTLAVEVDQVLASSWLAERDARVRAEGAAEALRDAAAVLDQGDGTLDLRASVVADSLRARADRIEAGRG